MIFFKATGVGQLVAHSRDKKYRQQIADSHDRVCRERSLNALSSDDDESVEEVKSSSVQ